MKLNLSDQPVTADLLMEALRRTGSAVIAVDGTSMHPTLQMGDRVFLKPAEGAGLRIGEIGVFRGDRYLTIHRLVWKERDPEGEVLVFRGDHNRIRERVPPGAVIARVHAVEVPGRGRGRGRVVTIEPDALSRFYQLAWIVSRLLHPILPRSRPGSPPGAAGRAARAAFAAMERLLSVFLPDRR